MRVGVSKFQEQRLGNSPNTTLGSILIARPRLKLKARWVGMGLDVGVDVGLCVGMGVCVHVCMCVYVGKGERDDWSSTMKLHLQLSQRRLVQPARSV